MKPRLRCRHRNYDRCDCTGLNSWTERRLRQQVIKHKVQGGWLDTWAALDEIDRLRAELRRVPAPALGPDAATTTEES